MRRRLLEEFSDTFSPAVVESSPADEQPAIYSPMLFTPSLHSDHQRAPPSEPEGSYLATHTEDAGILTSLVALHTGNPEPAVEPPAVLPSESSDPAALHFSEENVPSTPPHKKPSEVVGPVTPQTTSVKQTPPQTPSSALNTLLLQLGEKVVLTPSRIPKPKGGSQRMEKY